MRREDAQNTVQQTTIWGDLCFGRPCRPECDVYFDPLKIAITKKS